MATDLNPEQATAAPGERLHPNGRSDGITLTALYHYLAGGFFLLATVVAVFPTLLFGLVGVGEDAGAFIPMLLFGFFALVCMALSLLYLIVGYGLWTMRPWARLAAIALGFVGLMFAPIGTLAGAVTIYYLLKPEVAARFEAQTAVV